MTKKRTSLDSLVLDDSKIEKSKKQGMVKTAPKIKKSKIQKACYFESELVAIIEAYILEQKQQGNRGESFNKCVNEGLKLLLIEKGLK